MPAGTHGAELRPGASQSKQEPAREIRKSPQLRANAANTERDVVGGVCEAEGIRQIARILRRSETEEMWVFLPRAHGASECQWHEIGREERSESDGSYVRIDMAYVKMLIAENEAVHFFHFHPLKYFECASQAGCPREAASAAAFDARWITDLLYSMPSPSDVHFMMELTSRFNRRHGGRGTIRHSVVTPYGVVEYGLTDAGLAKYDAERHGRSGGLYITWVMASALADERLEAVARDHAGSIVESIRRLAQTLNTANLRVVHRPLAGAAEHTRAAPE
ncbi:MAG: hypothetical protein R3357_05960 [Burkholderiales bacterium]|nr:hypothetical protein [Burkholderiales bacterium]